uniref:Uncharacterized protein n=1 Tax=Maylandia zebra TaxID=106582 RepID=A0A3P9CEB0_9CICH
MSPWTAWSACSVSCGLGSLFRQRDMLREALLSPVVVNGHWSEWTEWSECDARCGGGVRQRNRTCSAPPPKNGGGDCEGMTREEQEPCNTEHCPVPGGWSAWSAWSQCSSRCDSGVQTRERLCNSPTPQHGGKSCSGPHIQTRDCNSQPCSGDGGWGQWSHWTECTKSCGGGVRSRRRNCDSPSPEGEGNYCEGSCEAGVLQCQSVPGCHVDGGWSQWGAWTECSLSCGGGVKFRRRLCDNPSPQSGGRGCLGDAEQQRDCNTHLLGPWLPWSQWSECSVSCGGGQQYRSRLCSLPACSGRQSKICNTHVCLGERLLPVQYFARPTANVSLAAAALKVHKSHLICACLCPKSSSPGTDLTPKLFCALH